MLPIYSSYDRKFFQSKRRWLLFALINALFFVMAVMMNASLAYDKLYTCSLVLLLGTGTALAYFVKKCPVFAIVLFYPVGYGLLALLGLLPFSWAFLLVMTGLFHAIIKIYPYLFEAEQDSKLLLWQFACFDDFDKSLSQQAFGFSLPATPSAHRHISDEMALMRAYNKELFFKNKIKDEAFLNLNHRFYVPKSLALVVYQSILAHCDLGVKTTVNHPITLKVRDYSQEVQFIEGRGDYMIEFTVHQENLKSVVVGNGKAVKLSDKLNQLKQMALNKGLDVYGIDHGENANDKRFYVVRIKYKKPSQTQHLAYMQAMQQASAHEMVNPHTEYEGL